MKVIICFRPISWMFRGNWYSLYRWRNPQYYENKTFKLIDIGSITVGISTQGGTR